MNDKLKIFMFDFVPLKNKGEEAILRGIEDLLKYQTNNEIEIYFFDEVSEVTSNKNLVMLPKEWFFKSNSKIQIYLFRLISDIINKTLLRVNYILATFFNIHVIKLKIAKHNEVYKLFNECDLIFAGHDGVFSLIHSQIILYAKSIHKNVGTFGAGGYKHFDKSNWIDKQLLLKSINQADFFYVREEGVINILNNISGSHRAKLAPDPAFFMSDLQSSKFIQELKEKNLNEIINNDDNYINVGVTIAHKRCNYLKPFFKSNLSLEEILYLHTKYLGETFDELINMNSKIKLIFLPHSLEIWPKNDAEAAQKVIQRMKRKSNCILIKEDLTPRFLKSLIRNLDFLIGQRAHSMIAAASVKTPFAALVSSEDTRTIDILGKMCEQENSILFMDNTESIVQASNLFNLIKNRSDIQRNLETRMKSMFVDLYDVKKDIYSSIH